MTTGYAYIEVNIFCAILMLTCIYRWRLSKKFQTKTAYNLMLRVFLNAIIYLIVDLIWGLVQCGVWSVPRTMGLVLTLIYYVVAAGLSFNWYQYSEFYQNPAFFEKNSHMKKVGYGYNVVIAIMCISSIFTGCFFDIDENGVATHGPLFFLLYLMFFAGMFTSTVHALIRAREKGHFAQKSGLIRLASFMIFPIAAGIIQWHYRQMPLISAGFTMTILQIYISSNEDRISRDPLTHICNRGSLFTELEQIFEVGKTEKRVYLFIMDIDFFKKINDEFGHTEGDKALQRMASVIAEVAHEHGCKAYRYGGDEFMILLETYSDDEADIMKAEILTAMDDENARMDAAYNILVSVGYAKMSTLHNSITDFIAAADEELYAEKAARKERGLQLYRHLNEGYR